jgi:hypothetical protein
MQTSGGYCGLARSMLEEYKENSYFTIHQKSYVVCICGILFINSLFNALKMKTNMNYI